MPTTLRIKVTKEILEKSSDCKVNKEKHLSIHHCAIAVALADIFPTCNISSHFMKPDRSDRLIINLPPKATEFIYLFDKSTPEERRNLPEIEFEISIPDEVIEKINIDDIRLLLLNHPTLELVEDTKG